MSREPGGSAGAEAIRHVLLSGAAKPLGAPRRGDTVRGGARGSSAPDDPARAGARPLGDQRPFRRFDPHLSGRARQRGGAPDRAAGKVTVGELGSRPHHHPRPPSGGGACARHQAPRRRAGRPLRGRGVRVPQEAARSLSRACRARAGPLRRHQRQRRSRDRRRVRLVSRQRRLNPAAPMVAAS